MEPTDRRGWRTLTDEQLAVAEDLVRRAEILHAGADGELSMAEAVALAAVQIGHRRPAPAVTEAPKSVKRCICGCPLGQRCTCDKSADHGNPDGDPDFEPAQPVPELVDLFRRPRVTPLADEATP